MRGDKLCPLCGKKMTFKRNIKAEQTLAKLSEARLLKKCKKHKDMDKCYLCEPCKRNICPECYIEEHLGHKKVPLVEKFEQVKK